MPPMRRTNIGRRSRNARNCDNFRYNQTQEERAEADELNIVIFDHNCYYSQTVAHFHLEGLPSNPTAEGVCVMSVNYWIIKWKLL